jgi:uncharacterized membrane protein
VTLSVAVLLLAIDQFGISVAVAGDTVVVGAWSEDSSTTGVQAGAGIPNDAAVDAGAAYIFVRSGVTWTQQAYLKPAVVGVTQYQDAFGTPVAVFGDTVVGGGVWRGPQHYGLQQHAQ